MTSTQLSLIISSSIPLRAKDELQIDSCPSFGHDDRIGSGPGPWWSLQQVEGFRQKDREALQETWLSLVQFLVTTHSYVIVTSDDHLKSTTMFLIQCMTLSTNF